jgi:acyl-CoA synthetase (AMP-forming)/AMP-acid ligase II
MYQFSTRDVERFTEEVLNFFDIRFDPPYTKLLDTANGPEFPTWLAGAGLNITTMCLDRWQTDEMKDQPAVIWEGEDGATKTYTYSQLFSEVGKCAAALRTRGLEKGDAIGIHLPMLPETVVVLLAINRIGAIAVPVFSGYGVEAIVSRMDAVGAKACFTSHGYLRRGKLVPSAGPEAAGNAASVEALFLVAPRHRHTGREEQYERARQGFEKFGAMTDAEKADFVKRQQAQGKQNEADFFATLKERNVPHEKIDEIRRQMEEQRSGSGGFSFGFYDLKTERSSISFRSSWSIISR